jgi:hypothetical protein
MSKLVALSFVLLLVAIIVRRLRLVYLLSHLFDLVSHLGNLCCASHLPQLVLVSRGHIIDCGSIAILLLSALLLLFLLASKVIGDAILVEVANDLELVQFFMESEAVKKRLIPF